MVESVTGLGNGGVLLHLGRLLAAEAVQVVHVVGHVLDQTTNRPRDLAPHASAAEARGDEHQQATGWPGAGASIRSAGAGTPAAQGPAGYLMCAAVGVRPIACGCVLDRAAILARCRACVRGLAAACGLSPNIVSACACAAVAGDRAVLIRSGGACFTAVGRARESSAVIDIGSAIVVVRPARVPACVRIGKRPLTGRLATIVSPWHWLVHEPTPFPGLVGNPVHAAVGFQPLASWQGVRSKPSTFSAQATLMGTDV